MLYFLGEDTQTYCLRADYGFPMAHHILIKILFSPTEPSTKLRWILPHNVSRPQWHFEDPNVSSWAVLKVKINVIYII